MISKKSKYAIHALVHLFKNATSENPIPTHTIAEETHVPVKFLETILRELKQAGVTASKKGKDGGYFLQKPAQEIHIAEILRVLDGPIALIPCVSYRYYQKCDECVNEATCGVKRAFLDIRAQTVELMKNYTLDKLIDSPPL
ncbi:Rrf2 family transcriptional regulator [bacterium]|nr:MAG: Rrf2 family transcriptional regulator [bacterium]